MYQAAVFENFLSYVINVMIHTIIFMDDFQKDKSVHIYYGSNYH